MKDGSSRLRLSSPSIWVTKLMEWDPRWFVWLLTEVPHRWVWFGYKYNEFSTIGLPTVDVDQADYKRCRWHWLEVGDGSVARDVDQEIRKWWSMLVHSWLGSRIEDSHRSEWRDEDHGRPFLIVVEYIVCQRHSDWCLRPPKKVDYSVEIVVLSSSERNATCEKKNGRINKGELLIEKAINEILLLKIVVRLCVHLDGWSRQETYRWCELEISFCRTVEEKKGSVTEIGWYVFDKIEESICLVPIYMILKVLAFLESSSVRFFRTK